MAFKFQLIYVKNNYFLPFFLLILILLRVSTADTASLRRVAVGRRLLFGLLE